MGPFSRRDDVLVDANFQTANARSPSQREAPEALHEISRPIEGVGNAGCPLHPQPRVHFALVEGTRVFTTSPPESPGIPARNGFNGFLRALPGDRALLPPSLANESANLTPASRRQDHTTSPSALAPFVKGAAASIASRTNVRDDRETPLSMGGTAGVIG